MKKRGHCRPRSFTLPFLCTLFHHPDSRHEGYPLQVPVEGLAVEFLHDRRLGIFDAVSHAHLHLRHGQPELLSLLVNQFQEGLAVPAYGLGYPGLLADPRGEVQCLHAGMGIAARLADLGVAGGELARCGFRCGCRRFVRLLDDRF